MFIFIEKQSYREKEHRRVRQSSSAGPIPNDHKRWMAEADTSGMVSQSKRGVIPGHACQHLKNTRTDNVPGASSEGRGTEDEVKIKK